MVSTAWLDLGKSAPINQEFELTVFDELDFSLTLQTKLERPSSSTSSTGSISSPSKSKQKGSTLSRLLQSPKKRREAEKKQQEEEAAEAMARQREVEAQRARYPTAWDLQHNIVGPDGSFARAIISLEDYEQLAFGRVHIVDVPCFNSYTRSKAGFSLVRRANDSSCLSSLE